MATAGDAHDGRQRQTLERLKQHLTDLPLLPVVVVELMRLDPNDDRYFEDIVRLVGQDPGFATKVIAFANSASSAARDEIARLPDAIARVGSRAAVDLVVASSVTRIFVPRQPWAKALWVHALQTAELAKCFAGSKTDQQELYLAGLLHDIGRFILYLEAPEDLREVDETHWRTPDELLEAELEICGFTHSELGYQAALKWHLPGRLANLVRHHHVSAASVPDALGVRAMVDSVRLADWVSVAVGLDDSWQRRDDDNLRDALTGSNVRPQAYWTEGRLAALRAALTSAQTAISHLAI
jgi:putative nucleotidyltransferase with HDIG domain